MKRIILLVPFMAFILGWDIQAQTITPDSLVSIVAARITQQEQRLMPKEEYIYSFHIEDIATRKPITEQGYGIYEFGRNGDDVDLWIMMYDKTGYVIFEDWLNTHMLGEILQYFKRNNFSEKESLQYIHGLYNTSIAREASLIFIQ